jgi:hypothetical protein
MAPARRLKLVNDKLRGSAEKLLAVLRFVRALLAACFHNIRYARHKILTSEEVSYMDHMIGGELFMECGSLLPLSCRQARLSVYRHVAFGVPLFGMRGDEEAPC